ncbi:MAG: polyhydroxybutyrate depolymerase [Saprospiraceae bacterium]|jgi:polyhydroxybutyrate depolymerase
MIQKITFTILLSLSVFLVSAQNSTGTIEHDGLTRDYILHLPTGYDANISYPFVYNLHGYTSNAQQQQFYSAMDVTSDAGGFIVCYPNGIDNSWNVSLPGGSSADDVGFLMNLVDSLAVDYSINYDRLYSCGMSNGGFMSYKLACEQGDKFAAIASVTGSIVPSQLNACNPIRKMPVMQIHGTADPTVAYNGSGFNAPIEDVIAFWTEENGCNLMADTIQVENTSLIDLCTAERIQYTDCEDGTEVVLYKIDGGGHTWPDGTVNVGVTNRDFNGSQEIWNFFNRFDLNGAIVSSNENVAQIFDIQLFPNPVSSKFTLSNLPAGTKQINVIDAFGKVLITQNSIEGTTQNINVESLSKGLYFVTTEGEKTRGIAKFVKQ